MTGPTGATGPRTLRCRLGWLHTAEWAGLYVADDDAAYAHAGLQVELLPGGPGRPGAGRVVAAGEADVGIASDLLAVLDVIAAGAPLRLLGATMGASPLGVAWPAGNGPLSMAALAGRRIGAGTEADRAVLDVLFEVNGLAPDYDFVAIGGGVDELIAGAADAICCSTISQPPVAARRGFPLATATFAELGLPMPADVVVAPAALVEERRADLVSFLRATARGWEAVATDPERGARLTHTRYGVDLDDALDEVHRELPFIQAGAKQGLPPLWIDAAELAASLDRLTAGGVRGLPAVADVVDLGPLAEALGVDQRTGQPIDSSHFRGSPSTPTPTSASTSAPTPSRGPG